MTLTEKSNQIEDVGRDVSSDFDILVIDDREELRRLMVRVLESEGYHVRTAASGEEALDIIEKDSGNLRLLISDILLPQMRGTTLAAHFERYAGKGKVLLISGSQELCEEEHHFPILAKPFSPAELISRVKDLLG